MASAAILRSAPAAKLTSVQHIPLDVIRYHRSADDMRLPVEPRTMRRRCRWLAAFRGDDNITGEPIREPVDIGTIHTRPGKGAIRT